MFKWVYRLACLGASTTFLVNLGAESSFPTTLEAGERPTIVAQSPVRRVWAFFQRQPPKKPRTVRTANGQTLCLISPGLISVGVTGGFRIWHRRPLLIWQGEGTKIVMKQFDGAKATLWDSPVSTGVESLAYPENYDALQIGGKYTWEVVNTQLKNNKLVPQFGILAQAEWDQVATGIADLEQKLKESSAEDLAIAKAEFFEQRNLWSDALQVLYQVENPSADFVEQRRSYIQGLCKPANVNAVNAQF
jgi:hypothetical protein